MSNDVKDNPALSWLYENVDEEHRQELLDAMKLAKGAWKSVSDGVDKTKLVLGAISSCVLAREMKEPVDLGSLKKPEFDKITNMDPDDENYPYRLRYTGKSYSIAQFKFSGYGALDLEVNAGTGIMVVVKRINGNKAEVVHSEKPVRGYECPSYRHVKIYWNDYNTYVVTVSTQEACCNTDIEVIVKEHVDSAISEYGGIWAPKGRKVYPILTEHWFEDAEYAFQGYNREIVFYRWYVHRYDLEALVDMLQDAIIFKDKDKGLWEKAVEDGMSNGNIAALEASTVASVIIGAKGLSLGASTGAGLLAGLIITVLCSFIPGLHDEMINLYSLKTLEIRWKCRDEGVTSGPAKYNMVIEMGVHETCEESIKKRTRTPFMNVERWETGSKIYGPIGFASDLESKDNNAEWTLFGAPIEGEKNRYNYDPASVFKI